MFEYDTNTALNGAVYSRVTNTWKNAIAYDQGGIMLWFSSANVKQYSLLMSNAERWGRNNGVSSVQTEAYSLSVEEEGTRLVITKTVSDTGDDDSEIVVVETSNPEVNSAFYVRGKGRVPAVMKKEHRAMVWYSENDEKLCALLCSTLQYMGVDDITPGYTLNETRTGIVKVEVRRI